MTTDRMKWKVPIREKLAPAYPCPYCDGGTLRLVEGSLASEETPASKALHGEEDWDPEWIREVFACSLRCANASCAGLVHAVGLARVEPSYDASDGYETVYPVRFMSPAPPMIRIPSTCPHEIEDHIRAAFSLFWVDPAAAGNRARSAIEELLTALRVPRFDSRRASSGGVRRRRRLTLNDRIDRLPAKTAGFAAKLHAIRWVGNEGSHSELTKDDVLDALEILEDVLRDVFAAKGGEIDRIVKQINKRRKPRSKKRTRRRRARSGEP